jgi:hypothetical protein
VHTNFADESKGLSCAVAHVPSPSTENHPAWLPSGEVIFKQGLEQFPFTFKLAEYPFFFCLLRQSHTILQSSEQCLFCMYSWRFVFTVCRGVSGQMHPCPWIVV